MTYYLLKEIAMIQVGDTFPNINVQTMTKDGPTAVNTVELFAGKKVVLFAVPGAYTPTCSAAHLPGFVVNADTIKAKGVDDIVCTSVNDAFVMSAWGQSANAEHLTMLADGNAELANALGLVLDASGFGMGARSKRYAMIIDNGVVSHLAVDEAGFELSSAEAILAAL
jgi:peroxiredoxin